MRNALRAWITDYAKGDNLGGFWRLYRRRQHAKNRLTRNILTFLLNRAARRHGGYLGNGAVIEGFLSLPHGLHGVYISRYARIGSNCRIYQNVTIGETDGKAPQIGDHCLIGAGAVVIGGIRIGSHVKIGAGPWCIPMWTIFAPSWRSRPASYGRSDPPCLFQKNGALAPDGLGSN